MGIRVEFNSRFVSTDSIIGKDNLLTLDVCVISCSSAFLTITFLFYLGKSKSVKQLYPKSERKFSPGGWVWLLFFILSVFSITYMLYTNIEMENKSKKHELSSLSIPSNSYSDGLLLFESTSKWSHSTKEIMDMEDMPQDVTLWQLASDSICELVMSGVSPKRRHSDYMSILLQSLPEEQKYFRERLLHVTQSSMIISITLISISM